MANVITGFGETAGTPLAAHDGVKNKVAFTGSTEVGKQIVQATVGNLKKVTLELGGKSPNVVFSDADPEASIAGAANAIFFNHGQCCVAGSRLFVEQDRFDDVVNGISEIAKGIKLGDGFADDTQMGPLVSDEQLQRVSGFLDSGRSDGAEIVTGGGRVGDRGYFVEPTVITNTRRDMMIVREEIFGPVVVAEPFSSLDEIAAVANDSVYGLGAGVWTQRRVQGPRHGQEAAGRNRVDQLLQHLRCSPALRWLQAIRLGQGNGPRGARVLHRGKGGLHPALIARKVSGCLALRSGGRGRFRWPAS